MDVQGLVAEPAVERLDQAFSTGLPGRMNSSRTLCAVARRSESIEHVWQSVTSGTMISAGLRVDTRLLGGERAEVLRSARHLRGPRVLCDGAGTPLTHKVVRVTLRRTALRANVTAGVHILRHTFCSRFGDAGCTGAGDTGVGRASGLTTTQRYMHLNPAALDAAIRLLDLAAGESTPKTAFERGGPLEAAGVVLSRDAPWRRVADCH